MYPGRRAYPCIVAWETRRPLGRQQRQEATNAMPATLVPFIAGETSDPKVTRNRFEQTEHDASEELRAAGGWTNAYNEALARTPIERAFVRHARERSRLHGHYTSRIATLERAIRRTLLALASESMPKVARADLFASLYGTSRTDTGGFGPITETERQLIERYRGVDDVGRQAIRVVFERVAAFGARASVTAPQAAPAGADDASGDAR